MTGQSADAQIEAIVARLQQGDTASAATLAARARVASPTSAELARLHGVALLMLGRNAEARAALETALHLDPADNDARSNLASALLAEGDATAAVALMEQVVHARPDDAALHNNLANALATVGDAARARDEYLAALALAPDHSGATLNLAAVELSLGRVDDAERRLRALLAREPHPQGFLLLGNVLARRRCYAEAKAAYLQGAARAPASPDFPYQAGLMADELQQYGDAARLYRRALQLDPDLVLAEGQLLFVLRRLYDWDAAAPLSARIRARVATGDGSVDPFAFLAEDVTPAEQLACARARAAEIGRKLPPPALRPRFVHAPPQPGARLQVGFVSAGFQAHATAVLTAALFEELGRRDDLAVHLFATNPDDGSDARRRLQGAVHAFHDAALEPAAAIARDVADARIDVLVDVDGWCADASPGVFALRPAPVQVNWLAYPGTSGAPFIDYLVADHFVIPETSRRFYSEAIAYLPRCYQPSDPTRAVGAAPPRSAFGLPEDAVVFASFNNAWKLNAASFARMCEVLRAVPGSVLWLLGAGVDADARLRGAAARYGVDRQRLVFSPHLPHLQHLARYRRADLFLDTNPYNAHTTASDAIWAGCPVLTRPGDAFSARVAGSLNHQLGLPELNASSDADFIAIASRLGTDRAALATLRAKLAVRRQASGLFDMRAYARDFSTVLHAMHGRRLKGLPPQSIAPSGAASHGHGGQ